MFCFSENQRMERRTLSCFLLLLSVSIFAGEHLTSLKLSHFPFGSEEKNEQKVMGLFGIREKHLLHNGVKKNDIFSREPNKAITFSFIVYF